MLGVGNGRPGAGPGARPADRLSALVTLTGRTPVPLLLITAAVVAANGLYLAGFFDPNPMFDTAGLTVAGTRHVLAGLNQIEPNTGFTAQALGHLAAHDWLSGQVPWWNPFEGVGAPLAGEMQSAALFPLVIVDILPDGQIWFHLILELVAGYSAWFLLARLVRSRAAATAGAVVFALNGTFAWLFHAAGNPVAFLPLLLLGVEQCLDPEPAGGLRGWPVVALALSLSLYAGFPETAYIDGLFAVLWAGVRISALRGRPLGNALGRLAAGAVVGVALAGPVLVAFLDYLGRASVGPHTAGYSHDWLDPRLASPAELMPYVLGPIFGWGRQDPTHRLNTFWGAVGGYSGAALLLVAVIGVAGAARGPDQRRQRRLRLVLGVWLGLGMARSIGVPVALQVVDALPGVDRTVFFRYADPSWCLALVVLAALGIDDLASTRRARTAGLAAVVVAAAVGLTSIEAFGVLGRVQGDPQKYMWAWSSVAFAAALVGLCLLVALGPSSSVRRRGVSAVLVLEAVALFVVPELSAQRHAVVDTGPVRYLQAHLGTGRFYTLGPIAPNYGSYWGIQETDINDLPVPKAYARYVSSRLDTNVNPLVFTGGTRLAPLPAPADELAAHLAAYRDIGVRYVVAPAAMQLPPGLDLPLVYRDPWVVIRAVPGAAPMYSPSAGCRVEAGNLSTATVVCDRPGAVVRRELYMPGWSATDDGSPVPVRADGPLFQSLHLRAGVNHLRFGFTPPGSTPAAAVAVAALIGLLGVPISRRMRIRRPGTSPHRCSAPSERS